MRIMNYEGSVSLNFQATVDLDKIEDELRREPTQQDIRRYIASQCGFLLEMATDTFEPQDDDAVEFFASSAAVEELLETDG